jgi:glutamine amidotransferase
VQIAVVDLNLGNLRSVQQALSAVAPDARVSVTNDANTILAANKVVLPGQGAIGAWFDALHDYGLEKALNQVIQEKPLLAICVGMQALFSYCDEDGGRQQPQPHSLWSNIENDAHFYFANSFCANIDDGGNLEQVQGWTDYGHKCIAAAAQDNVFAVQFHPEKSHRDGLQLLKNFTKWNGKNT